MMIDHRAEIFYHVTYIDLAKQDKFPPGSGLPVLSPEAAAARGAKTIRAMNPYYLGEIRAIAAGAGIDASFLANN